MIAVVTDSSSDLPADIARDLGITVVPVGINFGDRAYADGQTIMVDQFYGMLQQESAHPTTTPPPAATYQHVYSSLIGQGFDVLNVTVSAKLSEIFRNAQQAAMGAAPGSIQVIDSGVVSIALGSMAMRAALLAREGRSMAEITASLEQMAPRFAIYITVDTLTYLQRGGRVGRGASMVGGLMNVKPILGLKDGEIVSLERARSREKAFETIVDLVRKEGPLEEAYVLHAAAADVGAQFAAMIQPMAVGMQVPVLPLGPVVGANVGPGTVGVVTLRR